MYFDKTNTLLPHKIRLDSNSVLIYTSICFNNSDMMFLNNSNDMCYISVWGVTLLAALGLAYMVEKLLIQVFHICNTF